MSWVDGGKIMNIYTFTYTQREIDKNHTIHTVSADHLRIAIQISGIILCTKM